MTTNSPNSQPDEDYVTKYIGHIIIEWLNLRLIIFDCNNWLDCYVWLQQIIFCYDYDNFYD